MKIKFQQFISKFSRGLFATVALMAIAGILSTIGNIWRQQTTNDTLPLMLTAGFCT